MEDAFIWKSSKTQNFKNFDTFHCFNLANKTICDTWTPNLCLSRAEAPGNLLWALKKGCGHRKTPNRIEKWSIILRRVHFTMYVYCLIKVVICPYLFRISAKCIIFSEIAKNNATMQSSFFRLTFLRVFVAASSKAMTRQHNSQKSHRHKSSKLFTRLS